MADCHIGSWRDEKLKDISTEAFSRAVDISIQQNVDFVLICGDLFNTALPGIDSLKITVKKLNALKGKNIPVYIIPGSHDFSPSGKTMIDVLEEAELVHNVVRGNVHEGKLFLKFTTDKKTGVKITGILGKRGMLEKKFYESLDIESLEKEPGRKIFMFHSAIREMMPSEFGKMDSLEMSSLPRAFEYYAGGHVHIVKEYSAEGYEMIVYPGPLFPTNFLELEELGNGGFYIYDDGKIIREDINLKNTFAINIDAGHKSPQEVEKRLMDTLSGKELINTIVLIRLHGRLGSGKLSDINFKEIYDKAYSRGAFFVMRNTSKLTSEEFEEIHIETGSFDDVEEALIKEHLGQVKVKNMDLDKEFLLTRELIRAFSSEKHEGEKVHDYESRIKEAADRITDI
jgi:DNA repair exonuclease SbcCD nuclease subunit